MLTNNVYQEEQIPTQFERFWRSFRSNNLAMFGLWCLILIILVTITSPWLAPHDAQEQTGHLLTPPSWDPAGTVEYFLGTDDLGRDILSRLIIGSQLTFGAGGRDYLYRCRYWLSYWRACGYDAWFAIKYSKPPA